MIQHPPGGGVKLPPPVKTGGMPLTEALEVRRTMRSFAPRPLDLGQVSQLLWGADGASAPRGLRTSPSAGATYPLDLYLVVGERGVKRPARRDLPLPGRAPCPDPRGPG